MHTGILNGYKAGDKNGGPTELAKILYESLSSCNGYNQNYIVKRYYHWWQNGAFDTGPTFAMVFQKCLKACQLKKHLYILTNC